MKVNNDNQQINLCLTSDDISQHTGLTHMSVIARLKAVAILIGVKANCVTPEHNGYSIAECFNELKLSAKRINAVANRMVQEFFKFRCDKM